MTRPASMLLKDKTVMLFRLQDGKVTRFDIQDAS